MFFPVVMYECDSWTIKKAECRRIDAFELWCWRRLLRVPWTDSKEINPKGNQSWIFIGRTDAEAEALIFGHLMCRTDSLEKTLMLGKIESKEGRGQQRMRWLDGITTQWTWIWVDSGSWWWTGRPGVLQFMGSQRVRHDWATKLNWTAFRTLFVDYEAYSISSKGFLATVVDIMVIWVKITHPHSF